MNKNKNYLIGDTGLIGQNLLQTETFDYTFNSKNINYFKDIFVKDSNVILSCLPATKWLVNKNKLQDLQNIHNIVNVLSQCSFNHITLISTIDVYLDSPLEVDESYNPLINTLHYGTHRLLFEKMVKELIAYKQLHIVRLPALFGNFLKKNILFDLLNDNNVDNININTYYQWYSLNRLSKDLQNITSSKGGIFNLFTQPLYTADIIAAFFPTSKSNKIDKQVKYDWRTQHSSIGYIQNTSSVMEDIERFIHATRNKQSSN